MAGRLVEAAGEIEAMRQRLQQAVTVADWRDERMLELLKPYLGQRARVIRLLTLSGIGAPRFGPKQPLRDIINN